MRERFFVAYEMKPTYTLQILQAHPSGFQDLILALNSFKLLEFLMLSGISAHIFGPRNETVSEP